MLSLAAAIASLGLLQDSPAVVIGSMLLAPLMTPTIGAGLALAQANITLFSRCAKTILLGILPALMISLLIVLAEPLTLFPNSQLEKGRPQPVFIR